MTVLIKNKWKPVLSILLIFCIVGGFYMVHNANAYVHVRGYYRKNGTYVSPHYRSNPDGNPYNNWSFPGNVNPFTGKVAPGNPSTYLKRYNKVPTPSYKLPKVNTLPTPSYRLPKVNTPLMPVRNYQTNYLTKYLYRGMSGRDIAFLQSFLVSQGPAIYPERLVTGYFGPLTKAAVIRFQERYASEVLAPWGLTRGTGFVGATTVAKINQILRAK